MLPRHSLHILSAGLLASLLFSSVGCSDSADTTLTADSAGDSAAPPATPESELSADQAGRPADTSDSRTDEPAKNEPSRDAFLAAAQKGVNSGAAVSGEPEAPPFVSTPDNPGPDAPLFGNPPDPTASVDPKWRDRWNTSFDEARATAQAENKDILINFTGSDWCGWCIRLGQEVFQHDAFNEYAEQNFVLLELDFPRGFELEESLKQQNRELHSRFAVESFPTILLADEQGRAYAQTGYQPGGPSGYIEHLQSLERFRQSRDAAFAAAQDLSGIEKAQKLHEGLEAIQPSLRFACYNETVDQIIELDADGSAGLKELYRKGRAEHQFSQRMQAIVASANDTGDWDAVLADLDRVITDYAAFDDLVIQAQMLQLQVLRIAERNDDLIALADQLLKDENLEGQARLQVYVNKLTVLDRADRLEEALPVVDAILTDFADQKELRVNLLMTKASFLARLGQKDAARAVIQSVRESADPSVQSQIDDFEKEILAEPETPSAPGTGDSKTDSTKKSSAPKQ